MLATPLYIPEVVLLTPKRILDERGFFSETYNRQRLADAGIEADFVQDNHSLSKTKGVVRGLHFQGPPHAQGKLIRVARGAIFDVAVDIRHGSPSFGQHVSATLSAENWGQLWVPAGFAHGFCTLEADTEVLYKTTDYYAAEASHGIKWDDPALDIKWPVQAADATLSNTDQTHLPFADTPIAFRYSED